MTSVLYLTVQAPLGERWLGVGLRFSLISRSFQLLVLGMKEGSSGENVLVRQR